MVVVIDAQMAIYSLRFFSGFPPWSIDSISLLNGLVHLHRHRQAGSVE